MAKCEKPVSITYLHINKSLCKYSSSLLISTINRNILWFNLNNSNKIWNKHTSVIFSILVVHFKVSVSWIFVSIHLHVSYVSFFWWCGRIYFDKAMCDWLSPVSLLHHNYSHNNDNKDSNTSYRNSNHICCCCSRGLSTSTKSWVL